MIGALIFSNVCLVLMLKGVPTWLEIVLSFAYVICNVTALIIWEETKLKIKALRKTKGGE